MKLEGQVQSNEPKRNLEDVAMLGMVFQSRATFGALEVQPVEQYLYVRASEPTCVGRTRASAPDNRVQRGDFKKIYLKSNSHKGFICTE